ncbi:MAG TPA: TonB family protein [Terriglobales bacterium]|nr:TonB family protein [Terriglobales bacterium]
MTQVLSELDFTVELSFEPFITVKKLGGETYDALVVDCANEQNASVLFKGARSSTLNHSTLCVAVAEGQTGLANAFRIGANLVLTKPINIEQSKNTLRVARGLLRKNVPQSHATSTTPESQPTHSAVPGSTSPVFLPASANAPLAPSTPAGPSVPPMAAPTPSPSMPTSLLDAEQKRSQAGPNTGASLSSFASGAHTAPSAPSFQSTHSGGGFAAAPALAPEHADRAQTIERKAFREMSAASPLVTQDPIVAVAAIPERPQPPVPSFASYAYRPAKSSGGSKAIWIIPVLLIVGAAGYFGWKKYQPMHYLHARTAATNVTAGTAQTEQPDNKPSPSVNLTEPQNSGAAPLNVAIPAGDRSTNLTVSPASSSVGAEGFPTKEHIEISPEADGAEQPVTVTPKSEPLQVNKRQAAAPKVLDQPAAAPAPPALVITGTNPADNTIARLVTTNTPLPRPAPATLRISQGITQGLLIKRVPPAYPPAALQLRREGTVELLAKIGKSGAISNVKVISGDATLAKAAVDAVKQWKYRPYLLNGEPVEIETQISMIFRLPH